MRSDTKIHHSELLLTLDYLFHYTDEEHPATRTKICEHAKGYGLKYNGEHAKGNQVDRTRISQCLKFLEDVSDRFPEDVPFILQKTDSGKYYIEQRNGLNEDQVAKVLATLQDDKFAKDCDTEVLVERLLDTFASSKNKKEEIKRKAEQLSRRPKKMDKETMRRLSLLEKAYREGKAISIVQRSYDEKGLPHEWTTLFRVYLIKEIDNRPFAFLLPLDPAQTGEEQKYIFQSAEYICVASGRGALVDDEERDFNELFRTTNPQLFAQHGSLDEMLKKTLLPSGGKTCVVTFYFAAGLERGLKRSFESFFGEEFRFQRVQAWQVRHIAACLQEGKLDPGWELVTDDIHQPCCVSRISVDRKAFMRWWLSGAIAERVWVLGPMDLNEELAKHYARKLSLFAQFLDDDTRDRVLQIIEDKKSESKKVIMI